MIHDRLINCVSTGYSKYILSQWKFIEIIDFSKPSTRGKFKTMFFFGPPLDRKWTMNGIQTG